MQDEPGAGVEGIVRVRWLAFFSLVRLAVDDPYFGAGVGESLPSDIYEELSMWLDSARSGENGVFYPDEVESVSDLVASLHEASHSKDWSGYIDKLRASATGQELARKASIAVHRMMVGGMPPYPESD